MFKLSSIVLVSVLISCAKPTTHRPRVTLPELQNEITFQVRDQFRENMERNERIQQITDRLVYSSRVMCKDSRWEYGFFYFDPMRAKKKRPIEYGLYLDYMGLSKQEFYPVVTHVKWGSPSDKNGLKKGDRILKVQGNSAITTGKRINKIDPITNQIVKTWVKWPKKLGDVLKKIPKDTTLTLEVKRRIGTFDTRPMYKDTVLTLEMKKRWVCQNQGFHVESGQVNAYTDGLNIAVTTGMLKKATDEELALVIAHELAHCFEEHVDKKIHNAFWGAIGGAVLDEISEGLGIPSYGTYVRKGQQAGAAAFSQEFELEADYVGLYILARAGYPTGHAATFWRKMAEQDPLSSNSLMGTHPSTAERYILLEKTHAEIKKKKEKIKELWELKPNRSLANK